MTQYSYSRVDLWHRCPYHYKLKYIDHLIEMPRLDADNPLIVGHALHKGIESGLAAMQDDYFNAFPVRTEGQENEMIKLEIMLPKVQKFLEQYSKCRIQHEVRISTSEFIGFADLIVTAPNGESLVLDFKYSNSVDNYLKSGQPHLYKYFLDQIGYNVTGIGFLFIPKVGIRQKKSEDLYQFRQRLKHECSTRQVDLRFLEYDEMEVVYWQNAVREIEAAIADPKHVYERNPNKDCFACNPRFAPEYLNAVKEGEEMITLPKNERRPLKTNLDPDVWLYADSYVGKTTFWDTFDNVLMINTDGNTDNITSPVFPLKDEVTQEGKMTKRKYAWETFMELVTTLEVGNAEGYKTIVLDLMEDIYEDCRVYVLHEHNWEHETDGSYGKGWSMVTEAFNNAIKRLKATGLQVVYISKENRKDITLRGGQTRTTFEPNLSAKTANFLTGTVDITMRAYVNDDDQHMLQLQKAPMTFGGGRYKFKVAEVPLDREAFLEALKDAQPINSNERAKPAKAKAKAKTTTATVDTDGNAEAEAKPTRRRRTRKTTPKTEPTTETIEPDTTDKGEPAEVEAEPVAKPKRTRRTRKPKNDDDMQTPPGEEDDSSTVDVDNSPKEALEDTTKGTAPTETSPARPRRRRRRRSEVSDED